VGKVNGEKENKILKLSLSSIFRIINSILKNIWIKFETILLNEIIFYQTKFR